MVKTQSCCSFCRTFCLTFCPAFCPIFCPTFCPAFYILPDILPDILPGILPDILPGILPDILSYFLSCKMYEMYEKCTKCKFCRTFCREFCRSFISLFISPENLILPKTMIRLVWASNTGSPVARQRVPLSYRLRRRGSSFWRAFCRTIYRRPLSVGLSGRHVVFPFARW